MGEPCYSIVRRPKTFYLPNEMSLRKTIEGNDPLEVREAIQKLLQSRLDGEKFPPNLLMPVINRYQMNRIGTGAGTDKKLKKLLYLLWECLPKKTPDGKFLSNLVIVCGAFDRDLKHPNQYVCGNVLRLLSKTREPEVIRELVNSIEKCVDLSHSYQRKNAVLAMAKIYKNFPDVIPNAVAMIAEYLIKETDDECKRAALQALLQIDPSQAKEYLNSSITDLYCMNASIQLLFVELIQHIYQKGSEEGEAYIAILKCLTRSSSSPSVRYQAASTLTKFSRDPESIKTVASCFIDICAKESDNNVKLIALDSLINLRKTTNGAERILRISIMDILFILQSASDLELRQKILQLSLDLVSPLNVGGLLASLRQEIRKILDSDVLGTHEETVKYRRLLVETVHQLADRYPKAIIEAEMLDTLFNLLTSSNIGERTSSRLILLFKVFMCKNINLRADVLKRIQSSFNLAKNNPSIHRGLLWLMGDFSESKEQIEKSLQTIRESIGALPIVALERKRVQKENAGDEAYDDKITSNEDDVTKVTKEMKSLVTADGSYATQSAMAYQGVNSKSTVDHPPLRSYLLKGKFDFTSVLGHAFVKMAYRYQEAVSNSRAKINKLVGTYMLLLASILNLGHSSMTDSENNPIAIDNDHDEQLMLSLNILRLIMEDNQKEISARMKEIFTAEMRSALTLMIKNLEQENADVEQAKKSMREPKFDDEVKISMFPSKEDIVLEPVREKIENRESDMFATNLFNQISLTGTCDPIFAYAEFDVNQYNIGMKILVENRARSVLIEDKKPVDKTLENVTLELLTRGDGVSNFVDSPEPFLLPPRGSNVINTSVKVVSTENRRLFGTIVYDDNDPNLEYGDKERIITLNDVNINITDYIKPAACSYDDFRDLWRDCEWENKVTVKTKITNLKEYLDHLIRATNMRCVTPERALAGECSFLCSNLYAKSSFGEDALVNVSIEKKSPSSVVTGHVKIRSRSQGMALSLGEKITAAQNAPGLAGTSTN